MLLRQPAMVARRQRNYIVGIAHRYADNPWDHSLFRKFIMQTSKTIFALGFALAISLYNGAAHASAVRNLSDYGAQAHSESAGRKIVIKPGTKWINVTNGEVVTFVLGDQSFTYHVRTYPNTQKFDLGAIAPSDVNVPNVQVYVAQDVQG